MAIYQLFERQDKLEVPELQTILEKEGLKESLQEGLQGGLLGQNMRPCPDHSPKKGGESRLKLRDRIFAATVTRLFFLLLFVADLVWSLYSISQFAIALSGCLATCFRFRRFQKLLERSFLMVRRCGVCALSLVLGLVSPSFGMMVACTYFLMYDRSGIDEVVPSALKSQFKELFTHQS